MRNESGRNGSVAAAVLLFTVVFAAACQPGDGRGYTKARSSAPACSCAANAPRRCASSARRTTRAPTCSTCPTSRPRPPRPPRGTVALPGGVTQADFDAGQQLFAAGGNCFSCHGMDAGGGALGPNLRDGEWLHSDGSIDGIAQIIQVGVAQPIQYPGRHAGHGRRSALAGPGPSDRGLHLRVGPVTDTRSARRGGLRGGRPCAPASLPDVIAPFQRPLEQRDLLGLLRAPARARARCRAARASRRRSRARSAPRRGRPFGRRARCASCRRRRARSGPRLRSAGHR
jgi:hypothetical protein